MAFHWRSISHILLRVHGIFKASLFWIAMAFLSAGLFLAPIINGGKDPKYQKLGVDILFWALVVLVVGSFAGTYLGVAHQIPASWNFSSGSPGLRVYRTRDVFGNGLNTLVFYSGLYSWCAVSLVLSK